MPGMLLRGLVAAVCMLPSTILMGASLPAIVRGIEATPRGVSWWALLYGSNTAGAVFGCLLAGFYLLRIYNMATAALRGRGDQHSGRHNQLLSLPVISHRSRMPLLRPSRPPSLPIRCSRRWPVYVAIGLSGASALGAEVDLDPPDGHAASRDRLCLLDHSRRVSGRSRGRRRRRLRG